MNLDGSRGSLSKIGSSQDWSPHFCIVHNQGGLVGTHFHFDTFWYFVFGGSVFFLSNAESSFLKEG